MTKHKKITKHKNKYNYNKTHRDLTKQNRKGKSRRDTINKTEQDNQDEV